MPYARRQFRKARKFVRRQVLQKAKKRYANSKGNIRLGQVVRDVQYIKSALNTERKHLEIQLNSNLPHDTVQSDPYGNPIGFGPARPTRTHMTIYPLPLPIRGTAYNQRVGNQIKLTHASVRLQVEKANTDTLQSTTTWKCFIIFQKDGGTTLLPTDIMQPDANGAYTPMCFTNAEKFKSFYRPKFLSKTGRFKDPDTSNPTGNMAYHYPRMSQKLSTQIKFELNDDYNVTQMRPFIVFMSDDNQVHPSDNDHIQFSGTIRLSYVDN